MAKHTFEYDDATYTISAPGHVITPITAILGRVRETEERRQDRWHATYNAALTGTLARLGNDDIDAVAPSHVHEWCEAYADQAHGPLSCADSELEVASEAASVDTLGASKDVENR